MPVYPIGEGSSQSLTSLTYPASDINDDDEITFLKDGIEYKNTMANFKAYVLDQPQVAFASDTDPYFSNVVLHLKGDELIDSSQNPKILNTFFDARIDTLLKKYGNGSLFTASNGYFLIDSPDLIIGSDLFTIESWIYRDSFSTNTDYITGRNGTTQRSFTIYNNFIYAVYDGWVARPLQMVNARWNHIAIVGYGNGIGTFVNGILKTSTSSPYNLLESRYSLGANTSGGLKTSNLYIDSFRITKGVARYTANFNPEVDTFLNSSNAWTT